VPTTPPLPLVPPVLMHAALPGEPLHLPPVHCEADEA